MAVGLPYLEKMKLAAGLTAELYDTQVADRVEEARAEMVRVGIAVEKAADETDALIARAVRTFVCSNFSESEAEATRLEASFQSQIAAIALAVDYQVEEEA